MVMIALCISVLMQMLGAPVTLLDAGRISDELAGPVLEGFTIPPALPQLTVASASTLAAEIRPFTRAPAFASAPFHPPVR